MGSTVSKSKKKYRQSSSTTRKSRNGPPQLSRELSVPQNPQEWSQVIPPGTSLEDGNQPYSNAFGDGLGKMVTGGINSIRNSGNNSTPAHSNTSQPRTSFSNGRSSFSMIRGRKSTQIQRDGDQSPENDASSNRRQQPPLQINTVADAERDYQQHAQSSGSAFATSMPEQSTLTKVYRSRQSMENKRGYPQYSHGQHQPPPVPTVMDSPRLTSGAYKAPVPAIPGSPVTPSAPTLSVAIPSLASFPPPPQIATPPLPSSSSPTFLSPHPSPSSPAPGNSSPQESDRLWRESLRNAAAQAAASSATSESRKAEHLGLYRSNSNNSRASQSSSVYSSSGIGYGAGTGTGGGDRKQKQLSGSTFMTSATSLSPSPSNVSQSSSMGRHRSGKSNAVHPERESLDSSRSSSRQPGSLLYHHHHHPQSNGGQFFNLPHQPTLEDNASIVSLAGSKMLGRDANILAAGENDSTMTSRNASVLSLLGSPVSSIPASNSIGGMTGGGGGASFDHASSAKRWSLTDGSSSLSAEPSTAQHHVSGLGFSAATVAPMPLSPNRSRTAFDNHASSLYSNGIGGGSGSERDSMSSVSTANYQWMDEPPKEGHSLQDTLQRDSVLMFLNNNDTPPSKTASQFLGMAPELGALGPEQLTQQRQEQQTVQHSLLKYFFRGNYHAPCNRQDLGSVLDVGCGSGLWMRDMALEFPMTEIHGVDLIVPTRRRRPPRVNTPLYTTATAATTAAAAATATNIPASSSYPPPNYTSDGQSRNSNLHTTLQGNNYPTDTSSAVAEAVAAVSTTTPGMATDSNADSTPGSANRSTMTSPAISESMPSNCFFHKADITTGLPFADNTFDFCHVRLVLWGYQLNCFPDLLTELVRVTKKGGWIEFVDMDPCIKKATETGMHISEWIKTGLIHSNMDPDLVRTMPKFLKEYCDATLASAIPPIDQPSSVGSNSNRGSNRISRILPSESYGLSNLKIDKLSLPFGPWGGKVGELWQENFTTFLEDLEPMMIDATLSGLVMDQFHRQCIQEMMTKVSSGIEGGSSRPSSIDQKQCTHQAWLALIQRLNKEADAAVTHRGALSPLLHGAAALLPSSSLSSSGLLNDREMRSYSNFYIAYAQKVDLIELRQQLLLERLEEEILSPNPNPNPDGFSTFPMTSLDAQLEGQQQQQKQQQLQQQQLKHGFYSLTTRDGRQPNLDSGLLNTLIARGSLTDVSSIRQQDLETGRDMDASTKEDDSSSGNSRGRTFRNKNRYGLVAPLTEDALETFNRGFEGDEHPQEAGHSSLSVQTPSSSAVAAPPTPTSVAALSIRSNSRGRGPSMLGSVAMVGGPGTPGSVTSSITSYQSPRGEMTMAATSPGGVRPLNVNDLRRYGSNPNMGDSFQRQQGDSGEQSGDLERAAFVPDYFNQIPVHQAMTFHQQQYHSSLHQAANTVARKPSLLSRSHTPPNHNDAAATVSDLEEVESSKVDESVHNGETTGIVEATQLLQELVDLDAQKTHSDKAELSSMIVSLHEGDEGVIEDDRGVLDFEVKDVAALSEFPATLVGLPGPITDRSPEGTVGMVAKHHVASNVVSPEEENHVASTVVVEHTGYVYQTVRTGGHLDTEEKDEHKPQPREIDLDMLQEAADSGSSFVDESELQLLSMDGSEDGGDEDREQQMGAVETKEEVDEEEDDVVEEEEVLVMLAPEAAVVQGQSLSTPRQEPPPAERSHVSEIQKMRDPVDSSAPQAPLGYQHPLPPFSLHPGAIHGHPVNRDSVMVASPEPQVAKDLPRIPLREPHPGPESGRSNNSRDGSGHSPLPRGRQGSPGASETSEPTKADRSNNPVKKLRSKSKKWFKKL